MRKVMTRLMLALALNVFSGTAYVLAQHPCDPHDQACRSWCGEPCCPGSCDGSSCVCCCI